MVADAADAATSTLAERTNRRWHWWTLRTS